MRRRPRRSHLSADLTVVEVHQFISVGARLLHLHGRVGELGAHDQTVVQVVRAAPPAVARLGDLPRDGAAGAQPQVARGARPRDGVADGRGRQGVDKRRLPRAWW